jgi:hypothetical protein
MVMGVGGFTAEHKVGGGDGGVECAGCGSVVLGLGRHSKTGLGVSRQREHSGERSTLIATSVRDGQRGRVIVGDADLDVAAVSDVEAQWFGSGRRQKQVEFLVDVNTVVSLGVVLRKPSSYRRQTE